MAGARIPPHPQHPSKIRSPLTLPHPSTRAPTDRSKFFIGGNFKANGSLADATKLIATLNNSTIAGA
jgi:hypothetical protein